MLALKQKNDMGRCFCLVHKITQLCFQLFYIIIIIIIKTFTEEGLSHSKVLLVRVLHCVKMRKVGTINFRFGGSSTTFCNSEQIMIKQYITYFQRL